MENFLRRLFAKIKTYFSRGEYKKTHSVSKNTAYIMHMLLKPQAPNYSEHPFHKKCIEKYRNNLKGYSKQEPLTVAFGDSLLDIPRNEYVSIEEELNFSISGSWHNHMQQMVEEMYSDLKDYNVQTIVIGTLGGNPLLSYQSIDNVIEASLSCLNKIRELFPNARIIVYGLPPVYNINASLNSVAFEINMYHWVLLDNNSVFLPLFKKFAGAFGLFPQIELSADGVHFSPTGVILFDELIKKGKTCAAGSLVD